MPCPTCSHTLQMLFQDSLRTIWHCPRCGTLRSKLCGHTDDTVPGLVSRCREYGSHLVVRGRMLGCHLWHEIGIAEAINVPGERKPKDES